LERGGREKVATFANRRYRKQVYPNGVAQRVKSQAVQSLRNVEADRAQFAGSVSEHSMFSRGQPAQQPLVVGGDYRFVALIVGVETLARLRLEQNGSVGRLTGGVCRTMKAARKTLIQGVMYFHRVAAELPAE
jgi:hypothetical protein